MKNKFIVSAALAATALSPLAVSSATAAKAPKPKKPVVSNVTVVTGDMSGTQAYVLVGTRNTDSVVVNGNNLSVYGSSFEGEVGKNAGAKKVSLSIVACNNSGSCVTKNRTVRVRMGQ